MIPRTEPIWQGKSWQDELSLARLSLAELCARLELDPAKLPGGPIGAQKALLDFPLRVPEPYLKRIEPGNIHDPLLRQILPQAEEMAHYPGFSHDPVGEAAANPVPGLIHKYHGRVLLITTGACAVHCRYCFRRHFPYQDNRPGAGKQGKWVEALRYIQNDASIIEVILSGGDPLVAKDQELHTLVQALDSIPHLRRLRIHTRLPVVIPQRITPACLDWLTQSGLQTLMVIHCNHPAEIDSQVGKALIYLRQAGVTVLNQAVLLKGVNETPETQIALSESLFKHHVLPYYLHLLDKVAGSGHFDISEEQAQALIRELSHRLPGYLVPKLVKEESGAASKTPVHF